MTTIGHQTGVVPFCDLRCAQRGINLHVHQSVVDQRSRLDVADPLLVHGARIRVVAECPCRVFLGNRNHSVDHLLLARHVVEKLQLLKQLVELFVLVVGRVLAVASGQSLRVRTVEQEQEILGIRIVGEPSPPENLQRTLFGFLLKPVEIGRADFELHADLRELPHHPFDFRLQLWRQRTLIVVVQHERCAGFGIAAVGVAGLGEQFLRNVDRLAARLAIDHVINDTVDRVLAKAEHARRHRPHRGFARRLAFEYAHKFFPIDRDRQRLAQFAIADLLIRACRPCRRPDRAS